AGQERQRSDARGVERRRLEGGRFIAVAPDKWNAVFGAGGGEAGGAVRDQGSERRCVAAHARGGDGAVLRERPDAHRVGGRQAEGRRAVGRPAQTGDGGGVAAHGGDPLAVAEDAEHVVGATGGDGIAGRRRGERAEIGRGRGDGNTAG